MNAQPFARGTVLALLVIGAALFVGMLWYMGHGGPPANNGGGHAGGRGLNGFAGLAALAEADGMTVTRARSQSALGLPGVLVLTPQPQTKGADIERIVSARRQVGPTIVVTPKWQAEALPDKWKRPRGWTRLTGTQAPEWRGFLDDVTVTLGGRPARGWHLADGRSGRLPQDTTILTGSGESLVPLVTTADGRTLAAYVDDAGYYPTLNAMAGVDIGGDDNGMQPLVLVFEPDLIDNMGLADRGRAELALALLHATAAEGRTRAVTFDLTLAGLGAGRNLLTVAFEPPFLAATLGLILAMVAVGWRAFCRFGPAQVAVLALPLGKTTLVVNSAGLIRRARRLHLVTGPYADAVRERLVARLGLPRGRAAEAVDAALDARLRRPGAAETPFSDAVAALVAARRSPDAVRAAARLHALEKELV